MGALDSSNMLCTASTCVFPQEFERVGDTSIKKKKKIYLIGTSLVVQGLRLLASKAGGPGFDSWSGNYIPPGAAKEINNLPD